jgi:hypothetical protein
MDAQMNKISVGQGRLLESHNSRRKEGEGKRSLFYKKAPQKIFDGWCLWHGRRPAALEAARMDDGVAKTHARRTKVFCAGRLRKAFSSEKRPFA